MDYISNLIIITIIVLSLTISFYFVYKKEIASLNDRTDSNEFNLEYLLDGIKDTFNLILNTNAAELGLNKSETIKREKRKAKLRKALRTCNYGDIGAKDYMKEYIKDLLQIKYHINEQNIDQIIPFLNYLKLTTQDKFDILLYIYKKEYGMGALEAFIVAYDLENYKVEDNLCYEIKAQHIESAYMSEIGTLSFVDKLDIVTQRIYQQYKGHGAIDEIRDMTIDGVSAGVSGLSNVFYHFTEEMLSNDYIAQPNAYDSIWIFFHGKTIYLSFLGFGSQRELERVCKNIYRYDNPGQLSSARGYIANEMKDGSRVIVVRPPLTENWAFFIRKFDSIKKTDTSSLITDQGSEIPIETMKWLIKGCQVIGITGEQGCGKTTLLKALVEFINPIYTLRVQELIFELNLRKLYPHRNILTFKETATVSGQEALDLQKKTDGTVTILGEVASAPVARWLVQLSQVASKFTIFTHHAKTAENLVMSLRNSLLQEGGFTNESVAEEQVIDTVNFDIHMNKSVEGHRYIERITEILPWYEDDVSYDDLGSEKDKYYKQMTRRHMFKTVDIVTYEENQYILKNKLSRRAVQTIFYNLTQEEQKEFTLFFGE